MKNKDVEEIAHIAVIIGDMICKQAYKELNTGYIDTTKTISLWSIEFYNKFIDVNWEDLLQNPKLLDLDKDVICWDDAIYSFCKQKLKEINGK